MHKFVSVKHAAAASGLLALMVLAPICAQSGDKAEEELIKIQNDWATARVNGDIAFLERLYAKELRLTVSNGSVVERAEDISKFTTGDFKIQSIIDTDMKVAIYGDTAVVTGREDMKGSYKGMFGEPSVRFTSVYVRRDGRWQLVAGQGTEIPKSKP